MIPLHNVSGGQSIFTCLYRDTTDKHFVPVYEEKIEPLCYVYILQQSQNDLVFTQSTNSKIHGYDVYMYNR